MAFQEIQRDRSAQRSIWPRVDVMIAFLLASAMCSTATAQSTPLPQPPREFRAAWIASVANIDWPSKPGLSAADQQQEMVRILDRAQELNLNALIFQVRPAADALYESQLEPWSPYLSGTMGEAPGYDPLEFAVREAHVRGLELHVWFNPYRALHKTFDGDVSADHVSKKLPQAVKEYDGYLWLDPGNAEPHNIRSM